MFEKIKEIIKTLSPAETRGSWNPYVREPYAGAWQMNDEWQRDSVLAYPAVFSCITLISGDVSKMRYKAMQYSEKDKIWIEQDIRRFPILSRPNRFQNHIQFKESWMLSRLTRGNFIAIKQRANDGTVEALYPLDWERVTVLISDEGEVFYRINPDNLSGLSQEITIPASEVIHDRYNCVFHPLIGVSPLFACGYAASLGLAMQANNKRFFANASQPGGILTAPGAINKETADEIRAYWQENFTGKNAGRIAVLGDGLTMSGLRMTSVDAQVIEIMRWTAEVIASVYHVPLYKINVGQSGQTYNNIEALNEQYYAECLQTHIEAMELCLDDGISLPSGIQIELDLSALLRMDSTTSTKIQTERVKSGISSPNEARREFNLAPAEGGDTPYLQVQNYSLAALAARDAVSPPTTPALPGLPAQSDTSKMLLDFRKELGL